MATTIKLKNSVTTTNAPSSLVQGEVAINITDKKVWVGNAATTPIQLLGDGGSASFTSIAFGAGTVSNPSITFTGDTNTGIYSPAADTIAFTEGGVESMRIDSSGNVGIGTSSPTVRLDVNAPADGVMFNVRENTSGNGRRIRFSNAGAVNTIESTASIGSTNLAFGVDGTERMRIDSSGNVGIGTSSPAAKLVVYGSAPYLALQNSTTGATANDGFQIQAVGADAYVFNYENSFISFGTNASERMRITSTGDLLLGTTSSTGGKFHMQGNYARLTDGTYTGLFGKGSELVVGGGTSDLAIRSDSAILFSYGSTERMRITSGGNVCIGTTTTPNQQAVIYRTSSTTSNGALLLDGNGSYAGVQFAVSGTLQGSISSDLAALYITHEDVITFNTGGSGNVGGTERMRITSGGNVAIGNTSSGYKLLVQDANDRTEGTAQFAIVGNGYSAFHWLDATAYYIGQNSNSRELRMYSGSTPTTGVKLTSGATSWASTSDEREKDIIEPITDATNKLSELRTVIGKYKTDEDGTRRSFLIAQDVEKVFPEAVSKDSEGTLSLRYTDLIPVLVKAIQEQQAMIEELTNRIKKLEGV